MSQKNLVRVRDVMKSGVDIVDAAMAPLSGGTSQPNLNTVVEALRFHPRATGLEPAATETTSAAPAAPQLHGPVEGDDETAAAIARRSPVPVLRPGLVPMRPSWSVSGPFTSVPEAPTGYRGCRWSWPPSGVTPLWWTGNRFRGWAVI